MKTYIVEIKPSESSYVKEEFWGKNTADWWLTEQIKNHYENHKAILPYRVTECSIPERIILQCCWEDE